MHYLIMTYSVRINNGSSILVDAYMQGCERTFNTQQEAREYLDSFEEWEQDLLVIKMLSF